MALSFLDREHSIASPGFSRWLVPPAALAIHLSIGQVYAFSVFKNPLLALHAADGAVWSLKEVGYIFSIAIAVLGLSAALFGAWLERVGPRRAMFYAALCFGLGFEIASFGAARHSLALIYLGYGVVGGVGLGLGYISPVSTLISRGSSTGPGCRPGWRSWASAAVPCRRRSAGQQPDGLFQGTTAMPIRSRRRGSRWASCTSSS